MKAKTRLKRQAHNKGKKLLRGVGYVHKSFRKQTFFVLVGSIILSLFVYCTNPNNFENKTIIEPLASPYVKAYEIIPSLTPTPTPTPTPTLKPKSSVEQIIEQVWGKDSEIGLKIAFCESSYRPNISHTNSSATGLFQIINSTWLENRKKMGLPTNLNLRLDPYENTRTAYFIYQKRGTRPWNASVGCWEVN